MSWYVIEGPDDVGKTTLALRLEKKGWHYQKAGPSDTLPILARRMAALISVPNVVWDRAHLSEAVHHPDRIDIEWMKLIEQLLLSLKANCILLTQRQGSHKSMWEHNQKTHDELVDKFDSKAAWSALTWIRTWAPDPIPSLWQELSLTIGDVTDEL